MSSGEQLLPFRRIMLPSHSGSKTFGIAVVNFSNLANFITIIFIVANNNDKDHSNNNIIIKIINIIIGL